MPVLSKEENVEADLFTMKVLEFEELPEEDDPYWEE